jgi:hypothetical protein
MTVVEKNDDPLRQPPGFVKHGTPYGGSVTLSFGLGDHDVMVGLYSFHSRHRAVDRFGQHYAVTQD